MEACTSVVVGMQKRVLVMSVRKDEEGRFKDEVFASGSQAVPFMGPGNTGGGENFLGR